MNIVVTELLRDNFNLYSRHLALRYLQSVFSAPCSYASSIGFLGTPLSDTFNLCFQHLVLMHLQSVFSAPCNDIFMCYQQPLLRNFQCVFSATCSHKSLSMSSQLPLLTHFQSVLNTVLRDTLFPDNACTSTYPLNMTHGLIAMYEMQLYLLT